MKRIYIIIAALTMVIAATAQENKPGPGKTGVGFGITGGTGNVIAVSRTLKGGWEPGIQFGLMQGKTNNTLTDSVPVGNKMGLRKTNMVTNSMSVAIIPHILKHADIASNIGAFIGLQIPITFGTNDQTTTNTKIDLTEYSKETNVVSKNPSNHSVGANVVLGCQWFFVKNLCMTAVCGLGFSSTGSKGNIETTTTITNGGTLNLPNGTTTMTTLSIRDNKGTTITTFNNVLGIFLTYYL